MAFPATGAPLFAGRAEALTPMAKVTFNPLSPVSAVN
jgi:hypothetical protein